MIIIIIIIMIVVIMIIIVIVIIIIEIIIIIIITMNNNNNNNGVIANFVFLTEGLFGVLPLTYLYFPRSARAYLFPNPSKLVTFAAAPLVSTPSVRNQTIPFGHENSTPQKLGNPSKFITSKSIDLCSSPISVDPVRPQPRAAGLDQGRRLGRPVIWARDYYLWY